MCSKPAAEMPKVEVRIATTLEILNAHGMHTSCEVPQCHTSARCPLRWHYVGLRQSSFLCSWAQGLAVQHEDFIRVTIHW